MIDMKMTTKPAAPRVIESQRNDYLGQKCADVYRVYGTKSQADHLLQIANTMASAVRLSGGQARIVPARTGHLVRCVTYSRDAGYLWGRATGEYYVEVEVAA